jgi:tetratricopeptide (TPR) repeat protein
VPATVRSAEPGTDVALLAEIANDPATVSIRPAALSAEAVGELVRERLGPEAEDAFCAACHRATGGNPLFLRQLLTALETDRVRPDADHAGVVLEIGPRAVSRTVIMRLSRLSEDAIAVARAVAVLAESATLPAVAALTALDEGPVADAIGALARAEILRPDLPLGFVHALVRDAVYQELPLGERELQHEQAARVLREAGAPAEQVAAHLLSAPHRGQEWVAAVLREAGRAAVSRGAAESGVAHLRRALAEPAPEAWRPALLLELGLAEGMVDGPAAVEHLTEAFERLEDPPARAVAAHALGRALLFTGSPADGAALAERAVAELPEELEDDRRGLTAFALAAGYFGVGGARTLRRFDAYRDPPAPDSGVGVRMLAAPAALWWAYCGEGTAAECAALARAALHGGRLTAADNGLLSIPGIVTLVLAEDGAADAAWEVAHVEAHRRGSLHAISSLHLWHGFALLFEGDLEAAETSLREAQAEFEDWGFGAVAGMYTGAFLSRALIDRGRRDEARALLEAGRAMVDESDGGRYWRVAELDLLVAEGRDEEAVSRSDEYARRHGHVVLPTSAHWRSATARALDRLGRSDEAIARRGRARRRAAVGRSGHGRASAAGARRPSPRHRAARAGGRRARGLARAARARQGARRPRRRAAPRAPSERRPRAAAARARAGRRVQRGRARRARAGRALRHRRAAAQRGARRRRSAHGQRAAGGGLRGQRGQQPRHRPGALRDAQDRRGPPLERLPQAGDPLAPRARRSARAALTRGKDWGRRLGCAPMLRRHRRAILHA